MDILWAKIRLAIIEKKTNSNWHVITWKIKDNRSKLFPVIETMTFHRRQKFLLEVTDILEYWILKSQLITMWTFAPY